MSRESDINKLCEIIAGTTPDFYDNPNGAYEHTCTFCGVYAKSNGLEANINMKDLKHTSDCAYLIAKDLLTA